MTWNSALMPLPPCMSRACGYASALPQLLRLIADCFGARVPSSIRRADTQRGLEPQRDFGRHVCDFTAPAGWRRAGARLLAVERILAPAHSRLRPRPSSPRRCRSGRWLRQPNGPLRPSTFGSSASSPTRPRPSRSRGDRGAQGRAFPDLGGAQTLHALLEHEALIFPSCASELAHTTKTSAMANW